MKNNRKKKRNTKHKLAVKLITDIMLEADATTIWEADNIIKTFMKTKFPEVPPSYKEGYSGLLNDNIKDINRTMYQVKRLMQKKGHLLLVAKKPSVNPSTNTFTTKTLYWKVCAKPPSPEDEELKIQMDIDNTDKANNQKLKIEHRNKHFKLLRPFSKHFLGKSKEVRTNV